MTIRSTLCTLALISGAAVSGCELERTQQPTDTSPVEIGQPAPSTEEDSGDQAAALTGFGVHAGSTEPGEPYTVVYLRPEPVSPNPVYYNPEPFLTGADVDSFNETRDQNGNPALGFRLKDDAAEKMRALTGDRVGQPIVMTLDGEVLSAPIVRSQISRMIQVSTGSDSDAAWIGKLEAALGGAGAERVERLTEQALEQEMPGFQVYVASTAPSETYWGEFPLLESSTLWMNMDPILEDKHVASVERSRDTNGKPAIGITLTEAGSKVMRERADEYVDRYLVIAWEGRAVAAPRAMTPLGEKLMVTGTGLDPELPEDWVSQLMDRHGG